ncbi:hypothetical protein OTK49_20835 [Vibrio coralliirubri]|uniref:hypothetical protein n=1 Tax=Vibrio coralliirubri TaxID=1516159 RepID=UPI0022848486|nr:hypothetical protein [Vibrio coralliirubri]MCY9864965.1 hypothetical protein [Vibrio coralliirubri]
MYQGYQQQVTDTFIMPTDGLSPENTKSATCMIVAMGVDGNFYALRRQAANNHDSLCKAVAIAEQINTEKRISMNLWRLLDTDFVKHSYTYQSFH